MAGAVAERVPAGYCILADSAFFKTATATKIMTPISKNRFHKATAEERAMHAEIVSVRQAAEWAVRDLRGTYPRLTAKLFYDHKMRSVLMSLIIRLSNYRTHHIGLSERSGRWEPRARTNRLKPEWKTPEAMR